MRMLGMLMAVLVDDENLILESGALQWILPAWLMFHARVTCSTPAYDAKLRHVLENRSFIFLSLRMADSDEIMNSDAQKPVRID